MRNVPSFVLISDFLRSNGEPFLRYSQSESGLRGAEMRRRTDRLRSVARSLRAQCSRHSSDVTRRANAEIGRLMAASPLHKVHPFDSIEKDAEGPYTWRSTSPSSVSSSHPAHGDSARSRKRPFQRASLGVGPRSCSAAR